MTIKPGAPARFRARIMARVAAGEQTCHRCDRLITPGSAWHIPPNPVDPKRHRPPVHDGCERSRRVTRRQP